MTFGISSVNSPIMATRNLVAWKRVYIETDRMYKKGATVLERTPSVPAGAVGIVQVDSTEDFSVNDRVVVFWKEGQFNSQITAVSGNLVGLNPLPSTIPKWGGIRLQSDNETYSVDLSLLPKAYGGDADGRDGGAFIEFKTLSTGCDMVPKYTCFPTDNSIRANYAWYWFQHKRQQNVTHLLAASRLYNPFVPGSSFINYPLSVIFCEQATPPFENAETVVHELGHRMGLRPGNGGNFQHIDKDHPGQSDRIIKTHDGLIACVMGYDNPSDGTAEFCIDCILTGSTTGAEDSLRDCVDQ